MARRAKAFALSILSTTYCHKGINGRNLSVKKSRFFFDNRSHNGNLFPRLTVQPATSPALEERRLRPTDRRDLAPVSVSPRHVSRPRCRGRLCAAPARVPQHGAEHMACEVAEHRRCSNNPLTSYGKRTSSSNQSWPWRRGTHRQGVTAHDLGWRSSLSRGTCTRRKLLCRSATWPRSKSRWLSCEKR